MRKLLALLDFHKEKKSTVFILMLTILMTLIETVGISMMMPFVQIATDFEEIHKNEYYELVYTFFQFDSEKRFVVTFGSVLLVFFFLRTFYTIFYTYTVSKYSKKLYKVTAQKLFNNFIGLSYRQFIERNSSRMTQMIAQEAHSTESFIRTLIVAFGNTLTIIVVYILLLIIDWKITLAFTLILAVNVLILSLTVTKKVKKKGAERTIVYHSLFKMLDETFGNFKMIKLRSSEDSSMNAFSDVMRRLTGIMITNETMQQIPRLFLELISFSLIISIIIYWILEYNSDISNFMGVLTVFFFAMYRLMPAFNQVIAGSNQIMYVKKSLSLIRDNLMYSIEELGDASIEFNQKIQLKNIFFEYVENKQVLKEINLTIRKGENVAFVGPSGSGKSTIVDLIIGLYHPTNGTIEIDGQVLDASNVRSLRQKVGYIPQDIYLFDASIAENVALENLEDLDKNRVIEVLKQAHIYDFLKTHQQGIDTIVGERGVKLSGGQKQRIAIARALYHNPEILVLDEATSALDTDTETEIMRNIYEAGADKTLIIIAHRLSTIKECDKIYTIDHGSISKE